jgi:tetratricopeptide (TPR) repeat protein
MKKAFARLLLSAALCFGASACGGPSQRLDQARDLALSGHYRPALLEARALLFSLGSERSDKVDAVRRDALKLAGDLCALHLDDPRCAAHEYRELIKRFPTSHEAFEARERLGDLDLRNGDARAAIEAWRDQVAAAPDRPGADLAQLKITRAFVDLGSLNEARLAASELQSRWPGSKYAASAALLAASTFHLEGRHAEAARTYARPPMWCSTRSSARSTGSTSREPWIRTTSARSSTAASPAPPFASRALAAAAPRAANADSAFALAAGRLAAASGLRYVAAP